jgi:DNA-binding CsgD family transcriptional regulator
MGYENVRFGDLTEKRKTTVRETIAQMWADGYRTDEIAKKVKISRGSVATAVGNFERTVRKPKAKKSVRVK